MPQSQLIPTSSSPCRSHLVKGPSPTCQWHLKASRDPSFLSPRPLPGPCFPPARRPHLCSGFMSSQPGERAAPSEVPAGRGAAGLGDHLSAPPSPSPPQPPACLLRAMCPLGPRPVPSPSAPPTASMASACVSDSHLRQCGGEGAGEAEFYSLSISACAGHMGHFTGISGVSTPETSSASVGDTKGGGEAGNGAQARPHSPPLPRCPWSSPRPTREHLSLHGGRPRLKALTVQSRPEADPA